MEISKINTKGGLYMITAFKNFWKDYLEVLKASGSWMKKHWIGYIVLCVVIFVVSFTCSFGYLNIRERKIDAILNEAEEI